MIRNMLAILLLIGFCFAGLTVSSYNVSQESFKPGSNGIITLTVASSSTTDDLISGVNMQTIAPPEIVIASKQTIGDLEPGASTIISLPFQVASDAQSEIYVVKFEISGIADDPMGGYDMFTRRVSVPVTVLQPPILGFATDKQTISNVDELNLTVSNNGGPATNIRISIPETSSISLYGKDEIYIAMIEDAVTTSVMVDARDATDGSINIPFDVEYEDELGIVHSYSTKLRMTVRSEQLDLGITQKSEIYTRSESTLTLEVSNNGAETLEDVRLNFQNSSLKLKEEDEYKFGDLEPGESASVSLLVFTDLTPGLNLIEAELEWIEKDLLKSESRNVPITVTSDADVAVYLEAKPIPLTRGAEHTISVLVSNLGSYGIENVDVSLSSSVLQPLDISEKQYIGGLQRDDFSTVQFLVKVNATEVGSYPTYITINYRDQSGEWKQKQLIQSISVYDGVVEEQSPLPLMVGILLLVVIIWYFKFRKKK
ncbi:hypothetical protein KKB44_00450 [Candidatus Micrarchaeota archaeon]|nr:hypothetical protein [Candidatus Micrarchaeota archaeon]